LLRVETIEPAGLFGAHQLWLCLFGQAQEECSMRLAERLGLPGGSEAFKRILPNAVQHAEARLAMRMRLLAYQACVHQRLESVQDGELTAGA